MFSFAAISITVLAQLSTVKTLTRLIIRQIVLEKREEGERGGNRFGGWGEEEEEEESSFFQTPCTSS